jgi:hypothetical protein
MPFFNENNFEIMSLQIFSGKDRTLSLGSMLRSLFSAFVDSFFLENQYYDSIFRTKTHFLLNLFYGPCASSHLIILVDEELHGHQVHDAAPKHHAPKDRVRPANGDQCYKLFSLSILFNIKNKACDCNLVGQFSTIKM